jgi:hypothetical protein
MRLTRCFGFARPGREAYQSGWSRHSPLSDLVLSDFNQAIYEPFST